MKKQSILIVALAAGLALPAFAQDGFRVGVQLGSMKTTGDATTLGINQAGVLPNQTINTFTYDQPNQSPLSLDLAWVRGDDEYALTFLTSKKSSGTSLPMNTTNPYSFGILIGGSYGSVLGSQEQKATVIDLTWKHTFAKSDTGSVAFSAGLRSSKVSDEFTNIGTDNTGVPQVSIHNKATGTGFGLTTGIHGRMNFNDKIWLTSGFTAALINNTDSTDDYTYRSLTGGGGSVVFTNSDKRQSLLQTEAYLRFNVNFVSSFNGYLGYEVKNYGSEAAKSQNIYTNLGLPSTSGFGLAGFTLGLSYTF